MRTAIDTNVLSGLWSAGPQTDGITQMLGRARRDGALIISGVVYAELLAYPGRTEAFVDDFLLRTGIRVDFDLKRLMWVEAGRRFSRYAVRRRQSAGESPRRLLADFLIGAHAMLEADRLMTFDVLRFRQDFPELNLYPQQP